MGLLDGITGSMKSISGSAITVDGALRTQLGSIYSQISAVLDQAGTDGILRKTDMQNLLNMMSGASSGGGAAKQARILMMIVEINALKVQLQKLEEDLAELKLDATDPVPGDVHKVRRDINLIPSENAEDMQQAQRLLQQQNDMFQMLTKMLQQSSDTTKAIIGNMK